MQRKIWRNYPVADHRELVTQLLERNLTEGFPGQSRQPGQCCDTGCETP